MSQLPLPQIKNQNPPDIFKIIRQGAQDNVDELYMNGINLEPINGIPRMSVSAFNTAKQAWLDDQTAKRNMSADPEHYQSEPFVHPFPRREVVDWDDAKGGFYTWPMEPDPNIHAPVLPAYVQPDTSHNLGFRSTPDPVAMAKDVALFKLLAAFGADLALIKGKLGL
jgi:hypothetical protein